MYLVAFVRSSVHQSILSGLNCLTYNLRGSTLPSVAKSSNPHYQSKVFVCVSLIGGRMWIIARMRSIGF